MKCNKDESARAKEIAEKKFLMKDIAGAKRFAVKAQNLYPELEGIFHMLATLDVYISAENKICGEADWYGILDVNPLADEETVRKQYRKLALILHPDKNKSLGADGAFKLVSEAWSLLSDKAKRLAYDQKRNTRTFQQKVQLPSGGSAAPPGQNGIFNFTKSTTVRAKAPKGNTTRAGTSSVPDSSHKQKPTTFWTVCHRCQMQYEYLRMYLNNNLLCPNCREPFFAVEIAPPPSNGPDSSNHTFQWGSFFKTTGAASVAQAANMVRQTYDQVKRDREEAQAAIKRQEALQRKNHASKRYDAVKRRRGMEDLGGSRDTMNQMGMRNGAVSTSSLYGLKQGNFEQGKVSGSNKSNGIRNVSNIEMGYILMEKARMDIRKKLNEWRSVNVIKSAVKGEEHVDEKEKDNAIVNGVRRDQNKSSEPVNTRNSVPADKSISSTSGGDSNKAPIEPMSIDVPDPDFHDFDRDRTGRCFGENQVWAAYDDDDGMPRYYAMIHNVISLNPFKMHVSWLNSKTDNELGPVHWVGSGFAKTCGDFTVGKHEINTSLNSFSHKVRWTKGTRGAVQIYPRKGDVWALYRNWSLEWNELTADEVIHKYDMVEVLEDYDEELGVTVTPLLKVAGLKTVFHQHLDPREVRRIPREELFRFSHHIPSYLLTGQEVPNAPKGCRELDPAATPFELLQAITGVKEAEIMENEENIV